MAEKEKESKNDEFLQENKVIFNKYKPLSKIDQGSFGNIYKVIRLSDQKEFALKIEKKNNLIRYLESEAYHLFNLQKGYGFPKLISFGKIKKYNILIETLLGKSLYNIYFKTENKCNLADACLIGLQILDRLEYIHSKNLIYRDVKPENFLIGIDDPSAIYIIDFGLCKKYRSSKTGKHILPKLTKRFNGTISYVSPNVFKGKESSRRDDLISLGYMILYLIKKNIPKFPFFKDLNRQQYYQILFFKESYDEGKLFKGLPQEIFEYTKYTKNLKFEQDPDYSFLRSLFTKILSGISFNYSNIKFSWIDPSKKELIRKQTNNSLRRRSPLSKLYKRMIDRIRIKRISKPSKYNITDINNLTKSKHQNNKGLSNSNSMNNYIKTNTNSEYVSNDKNNLIINENNQFNIILPGKIESCHYKKPSLNKNIISHVSNLTIVNTTRNFGNNKINPYKYISEKTSMKYKQIFDKNNIRNNQIGFNSVFDISKNLDSCSMTYKKKPISKNDPNFRKLSPIINIFHNKMNYSLKNEKYQKTNKNLANRIQSSRKVNRMDKINRIIQLKNKILNKENIKRKIYSNKTMRKSQINENYFAIFDQNNNINYTYNLFNNNANDNLYNSEILYKKISQNIYK